MIQEEDIRMLSELSRIVERHGADSVLRLARLIRDPQSAAEIAAALENAARKAPQNKAHNRRRNPDRVGMGVLNRLEESDPQKHTVIAEFRDRLVSGNLLGSMNELRQFARMHNLPIGKATSRNAAIAPFLRALAEMETSAISSLLDSLSTTGNRHFDDDNDRSLDRWRNLIVKPKKSYPFKERDSTVH